MRIEMRSHLLSKQEWLSVECSKSQYMTPCRHPDQKFECVTRSHHPRFSLPRSDRPHHQLQRRYRIRKCHPKDVVDRKDPVVTGNAAAFGAHDEDEHQRQQKPDSRRSAARKRSGISESGPQSPHHQQQEKHSVSDAHHQAFRDTRSSRKRKRRNIETSVHTNQKECYCCCKCPRGALFPNEGNRSSSQRQQDQRQPATTASGKNNDVDQRSHDRE